MRICLLLWVLGICPSLLLAQDCTYFFDLFEVRTNAIGTLSRADDCGLLLEAVEMSLQEGLQSKLDTLTAQLANFTNPEVCTCFDNFNKDQKIRLLNALNLNLLIENSPKADELMQDILTIQPDFDVDSTNVQLFPQWSSFRKWPILTTSLFAGINLSWVQVMQKYGIDQTDSQNINYQPIRSYQIGLSANLPLYTPTRAKEKVYFSMLEGQFDVIFARHSYRHDQQFNTLLLEGFNFSQLRFIETQWWTNINAGVNWNIRINEEHHPTWIPYVYGGLGTSLLLNTELRELIRVNEGAPSKDGGNYSIKTLRKQWNYLGALGIGIKYKLGTNYLATEIRYSALLNNIANPDNRYDDHQLLYSYGYVSNDFRQHFVMLSLKFYWNHFRPQQLFIEK